MKPNLDTITAIIGGVYEESAKLSAEERQKKVLEGINTMICGIFLNPEFTPLEFGFLSALISSRFALSAGIRTFDEAKEDMLIIADGYQAMQTGQPLSDEIIDFITYYTTFGQQEASG